MQISKRILLVILSVLIFTEWVRSAGRGESPFRFHELTVYAIPSPVEFDWSSPSALFNTYVKSLAKTMLTSYNYTLGHMFVILTSPDLEEPLFTGMRSVSRSEQQEKVLRDKIGLGILGVGLKGRLEQRDELEAVIRQYTSSNNLASITYRISDTAFKRIMDFIERFDTPDENNHLPSAHYGGTFWPLYEHEGAGCSAFGVAMLELAGIDGPELKEWRVEVNIPMELVGGQLNPGRKVAIRDLRRAKSWHDGSGKENIDYIPFMIYDPTLVYNWINNFRASEHLSSDFYVDVPAYPRIPRLFSDVREKSLNGDVPIITHRPGNNLFIHNFLEQNGLLQEYAGRKIKLP